MNGNVRKKNRLILWNICSYAKLRKCKFSIARVCNDFWIEKSLTTNKMFQPLHDTSEYPHCCSHRQTKQTVCTQLLKCIIHFNFDFSMNLKLEWNFQPRKESNVSYQHPPSAARGISIAKCESSLSISNTGGWSIFLSELKW